MDKPVDDKTRRRSRFNWGKDDLLILSEPKATPEEAAAEGNKKPDADKWGTLDHMVSLMETEQGAKPESE